MFWNLPSKNKPDRQQSARFKKITKSAISLHPTTQQPGWGIPRTDSLVIKEKVLRELFIDVTIPTSQALDWEIS